MMGSYHFQLLAIFVSKVPARTCHTPQWRASHPPAGLQRHHNHLGFQALTVRKRSEYDSKCGSDTWYLQSFIYIYIQHSDHRTKSGQSPSPPALMIFFVPAGQVLSTCLSTLALSKIRALLQPPFLGGPWATHANQPETDPDEKLHDWKVTMLSIFGCPS